jgi:acyl-CoA synthetase (NDP forming)
VEKNQLNDVLRPKSVAIVGASSTPGKIGYSVIKNLLEGKYQGKIYPINPTATEILGIKVYPDVASVPGEIDAAIITIPAKFVIEVAEECGKKGVKGLIVITSGFSEIGRKDLEEELVKTANKYGKHCRHPLQLGSFQRLVCSWFTTGG